MKVIDIHTHTFPAKIAARALETLKAKSHSRAFTDGTIEMLAESMNSAGIWCSVIQPVATNPKQVVHVNDSSIAINERFSETGIMSFGAMHPDFEEYSAELERLSRAGIKGIKLHPVYQGVNIDDERYARAFVKDKIRYNKWGRRKVQQGLWTKRISPDIQQRVLDEIDEREYLDVLRPLLKQKRKSTKAASDYELNQKLVRFALSRGFGFDIIRQCLDVEDSMEMDDETD